MNRLRAIYLWDLTLGLHNRFLQVFALACVLAGSALLAAAPGPETLPLVLIQAILFFGSLFAALVGWASGQQARSEAAMLFAQPIGPGELLVGKLLGTGTWALVLLLLFIGPAVLRAEMPGAIAALGSLSLAFLLVSVLAGLVIGVLNNPVSGLLGVLLAWAVAVAGWELGLLLLSDFAWMQQAPSLFVTLLLINPAGMFRIGAMLGLETVPLNADELDAGRLMLSNIWLTAAAVFTLWLAALLTFGRWALARQEF